MKQRPPDSSSIREDANSQHHNDGRRQLCADANLIAHIDDRGRDQDIGDERHNENPISERALQVRTERPEEGIHRGNNGDRKVRLEDLGNRWLQHDAEHDPRKQAQQRDPEVALPA